jgi:TetR/AcrR family transcriptional repressor of nem operon
MKANKKVPTRQRIIEAAVHLFYENGFAATGMAEILKRAKANSGSFYFFFKSKEELLLAVLAWYQEMLEPVLMHPVYQQESDPIERVFCLLRFYRNNILRTDFAFGCPLGRLALEIDPALHHVHKEIAANFTGWANAVRKCLDDAGSRLPEDVDRAKLGQFVLTVMEGGVMQSRSHRSIAPFDASVAQLRDYLERLQQQAAQGSRSRKSRPNTKKKERKK